MMFTIKDFKEPKRLVDRLPWAFLVDTGTVLSKTGTFQRTIEFRGPDLFSATEAQIDALSAKVNNALKRLGSGWSYFIEARRQRIRDYPSSRFPTLAGRMIEEERKKRFSSDRAHYVSRYYLTFVYLTPEERVNRLADRFFMRAGGPVIDYVKQLEHFQTEVSKIFDILRMIFPLAKKLSDDETLTYLHSTVSTKQHLIRAPKKLFLIDALLTDQVLRCGLDMQLGEDHLKVLSLNAFPLETFAGILDDVNKLDFQYRWMTRFICMDKTAALKQLRRFSRKWFGKRKSIITVLKEALLNQPESDILDDSDAVNKSLECGRFSELIASSAASAGFYTSAFVLWDRDRERLQQKVRALEQIINGAGFACIDETFNAVQAWFGTLPGHCWANIRRPVLSSLNLSHLIPVSVDWDGADKDHDLDAPPLFYAATDGGTPFRFSLHVGDVGHTIICGPTGSGKSVLLSFMAASFLRYQNARVVMFDKEYSSLGITAAMDGAHYDLGADDDIVFQPLQDIDQESERSWALDWLLDIVIQQGGEVTPALRTELWSALNSLSASESRQRTMTGLVALVQSRTLRDAFEAYTLEGPFGHLLDADHDNLHISTWQCFEMDHLMNYMPRAVAPVLTYLFHQLDRTFTGHPAVIFLDEVWLFLDHPLFAARIRHWLKTLRKRNVSVVFATQTLSDVMQSDIVSTLVDSCPSRIYLPNPRAREESLYKLYRKFGLNDRQIEIIAGGIPKKEYYLQSDAGNRKFDLSLGPIALTLCGSSSREDIVLIKDLMAQTSDRDAFVKAFLQAKKDVRVIGGYHEALAN